MAISVYFGISINEFNDFYHLKIFCLKFQCVIKIGESFNNKKKREKERYEKEKGIIPKKNTSQNKIEIKTSRISILSHFNKERK